MSEFSEWCQKFLNDNEDKIVGMMNPKFARMKTTKQEYCDICKEDHTVIIDQETDSEFRARINKAMEEQRNEQAKPVIAKIEHTE